MMALLTGIRGHLIGVLICISLVTTNVEDLFMHLLAIHVSSLEKGLFRVFANFFNWGICDFAVELYEFFIYFGY